MGKRFTDTDKWTKQWFGDLSIREKVLWLYCCDACDAAGIADFSTKFFSVSVGFPVKKETLDKAFGDRIVWLESSKFFIPSFIEFQYGQLTEACKPHKPIIKELEKLGLLVMENGKGTVRVLKGYSKGINTLEEKEKEQEQEKETKGVAGEKEPFADFWAVYPKQRIGNKDKARAAFVQAVKRSGKTPQEITAKAAEYAQSEEVARGFAKGAQAWLNDDRFLRNYAPAKTSGAALAAAREAGTAKIDEIFGGSK
nr:MAG TPA_asm: putative replisome organizer protein [Caudoviricetes sp.]